MSLSVHNIKYWTKMLTGKSINHVKQGLGTQFVAGELRGYFNDMRNKVLLQPELLSNEELPLVDNNYGERILFPVAVFQYALGLYDLYLETGENIYLQKFGVCVDWAINNQNANGSWDNFSVMREGIPPFSAMCQGEGASLLVRAYHLSSKIEYKEAAFKALGFMLKPVSEGGTSIVSDDSITLLECTNAKMILNGSIFAFWGLYDYCLIDNNAYLNKAKELSLKTIIDSIPQFDTGYWSYYSLDGKIASPFYHHLHIAQLEALSQISTSTAITMYLARFRSYQGNLVFKVFAFSKKAFQKVFIE